MKIIIDQFNQCTIAKKEATKLSGYEARQVHEWFMKRKKQVHAELAEKNFLKDAKRLGLLQGYHIDSFISELQCLCIFPAYSYAG